MAVYVSNITIDQGVDFSSYFGLEDSRTNSSLYLVGYGSSNYVSFASSISAPETGIISISLTDTQTLSLKPGRYVYDVILVPEGLDSGNAKYKAVEGMALVRPGVTR